MAQQLGKEKAEETPALVSGFYTGFLGSLYKSLDERKSRESFVADIFLVNFSPGESADNTTLMDYNKTQEGVYFRFKTKPDGSPIVDNIIFRFRMPSFNPSIDKPFTANFFAHLKRTFARAFEALQDDIIDWDKVYSGLGRFMSFTLVKQKNSNFVNLDVDSVTVHKKGMVSKENLEELYKVYEDVMLARQAQSAESRPESAPAPPSGLLGDEDDLPF